MRVREELRNCMKGPVLGRAKPVEDWVAGGKGVGAD